MDETLARPVSDADVRARIPAYHAGGDRRQGREAGAHRPARLAQVFDVEDGDDQAYVVPKWVGGESLTDMLADNPLEPGQACALIADASRALVEAAHAAGQSYTCG